MDIKSLVADYLDTVQYVIEHPTNKVTFLNEVMGLEFGMNPADRDKKGFVDDLLAVVIREDLFDYLEVVTDEAEKERKFAESIDKLALFGQCYDMPDLALAKANPTEDDLYDHVNEDPGLLIDLAEKMLAAEAPAFVESQDSDLEALFEYFATERY